MLFYTINFIIKTTLTIVVLRSTANVNIQLHDHFIAKRTSGFRAFGDQSESDISIGDPRSLRNDQRYLPYTALFNTDWHFTR